MNATRLGTADHADDRMHRSFGSFFHHRHFSRDNARSATSGHGHGHTACGNTQRRRRLTQRRSVVAQCRRADRSVTDDRRPGRQRRLPVEAVGYFRSEEPPRGGKNGRECYTAVLHRNFPAAQEKPVFEGLLRCPKSMAEREGFPTENRGSSKNPAKQGFSENDGGGL